MKLTKRPRTINQTSPFALAYPGNLAYWLLSTLDNFGHPNPAKSELTVLNNGDNAAVTSS